MQAGWALIDPRRSLRARFAWLIGLSGLVLAVVTAFTVERLQRDQLTQMRGQAMQREAVLLARSLDNALRERLEQVQDTANNPLLASGLWEAGDARMLLENLRNQQPALAWLAIVAPTGEVLVATGTQLEGSQLQDEPWFAPSLAGPYIGSPRPAGPLTNSLGLVDGSEPWLIDLAVPLVDMKGRANGVLVARLRWAWLDGLFKSLQPQALNAPGSQAWVLSRDGQVILGPTDGLWRPLPIPRQAGRQPAVLDWSDAGTYLTAWSTAQPEYPSETGGLVGPNLEVVVHQPTALAFQDAQALLRRLLLIGALGTLAFMTISIWLADWVARPVRALSAAALRVVHDLPPDFAQVGDERQDEVAEVARALEQLHGVMAQRLAEQHRAQAALQDMNTGLEQRVAARTAELETANAELDAFAYAVSHDLRAPLRAMSGFSQALMEDHGPRLDDEARGYIAQITTASRRMGEQIEGLLTLSRSVRGELDRGLVDLSALALTAVQDLQQAEPNRRVEVVIEPGMLAYGDARMLGAVMANLLGNAWKYTAQVPHAQVHVHAQRENGVTWTCVADNGAGFNMAHAGRLFKAFSRLHRQDEFPGLGIGLATVARIIRRHGGRIEAIATPGAGATFRFTLPLKHPGAPRPAESNPP